MYSESLHRRKPLEIRENRMCYTRKSAESKKGYKGRKTPKNPVCYIVIPS